MSVMFMVGVSSVSPTYLSATVARPTAGASRAGEKKSPTTIRRDWRQRPTSGLEQHRHGLQLGRCQRAATMTTTGWGGALREDDYPKWLDATPRAAKLYCILNRHCPAGRS